MSHFTCTMNVTSTFITRETFDTIPGHFSASPSPQRALFFHRLGDSGPPMRIYRAAMTSETLPVIARLYKNLESPPSRTYPATCLILDTALGPGGACIATLCFHIQSQ